MIRTEHAITAMAIAALVIICLALLLAFLVYRFTKRTQEGFSREQWKNEQARISDLVRQKADEFKERKAHTGAPSLQLLSQLGLEEIGSDKNIRLALTRIQKLQGIDPWAGKAAAVDHVDLYDLFSYVAQHKIDLASADLSKIVLDAQESRGKHPPIERSRRRQRSPLTLVSVGLVSALLVLVGVRASGTLFTPDLEKEEHRDSVVYDHENTGIDPPSIDDPPEDPEAPKTIPWDSQASPGLADSQWIAAVLGEVRQTREVMKAAQDSVDEFGKYLSARNMLMRARLSMSNLQTRPHASSLVELSDVIIELDQQISTTLRLCEAEVEDKEKYGEEIPVCK
jgi:hypothetical protein